MTSENIERRSGGNPQIFDARVLPPGTERGIVIRTQSSDPNIRLCVGPDKVIKGTLEGISRIDEVHFTVDMSILEQAVRMLKGE